MKINRAVIILGPTAVGKTALTESLFSEGAEIINADSIQVYEHFDIGSAKPDLALQKRIKHHLLDVRKPWQQYTAGDFCRDAEALIEDINSRGKMPVISGGTAYYLKQLLYGPSKTPEADLKIRERVQALVNERGKSWAYEELKRIDPLSAARIYENDLYRITRALEVYYQSGRVLSSYQVSSASRRDIDFFVIGLRRDKKELEERIRSRVSIMVRQGLYDEIKYLFSIGADSSWPAMQGIGYREFLDYRESGELNMREVEEEIIHDSIKYAKRQLTFFSSFDCVSWFHPDELEAIKRAYMMRFIGAFS